MVFAESLLNDVHFLEYYSVAGTIHMLELLYSHYIFAGMLKIEGKRCQIFSGHVLQLFAYLPLRARQSFWPLTRLR